jgi:hypothetical protein
MYDIINTFNLHQIISDPTRLTKNTATLLDVILVNNRDIVIDSGVMPCDPITTDHEAVYCDIKCDKTTVPYVSVQSRSLKMLYSAEFQQDLQSINWHTLFFAMISISNSVFLIVSY